MSHLSWYLTKEASDSSAALESSRFDWDRKYHPQEILSQITFLVGWVLRSTQILVSLSQIWTRLPLYCVGKRKEGASEVSFTVVNQSAVSFSHQAVTVPVGRVNLTLLRLSIFFLFVDIRESITSSFALLHWKSIRLPISSLFALRLFVNSSRSNGLSIYHHAIIPSRTVRSSINTDE